MGGAAIETTLELWAASLREVKVALRPNASAFQAGPTSSEQRRARRVGTRKDKQEVECSNSVELRHPPS